MRNIHDYLDFKNQVNESIQLNEGALADFLKKAGQTVSGAFQKLKTFVVNTYNGAVLKVTPAVNSFIAYAKGYIPKEKITMSLGGKSASQFKKYGASGSTDDIVKMAGYISTIDMWKGKGVNEELIEFEKSQHLNEDSTLSLAHPDVTQFGRNNINEKQLGKWLNISIKNPTVAKPLLIWGAPGIGKTAIIEAFTRQVSDKKHVIAVELPRMAADDFTLPYFEKDSDGKILNAEDLPKSWLPCYKPTGDSNTDRVADNFANGSSKEDTPGEGGILFFDEISRCSPKVQNVALRIINERTIGEYILGSKWAIVAAANRRTDDEIADIQFSKTLANRFMHVNFVPTLDTWLSWANKKKYMNQDVLNFIKFNEKYWYQMHPDNEDEMIFPTPRSWEGCCITLSLMADAGENEGFSLDSLDNDTIEMVVSSAVGSTVAGQFMTYYRLTQTVDIESLYKVWDKPKQAPKFRKEIDLNYFMTSKVLSARTTIPEPKQFANFVTWLCTSDSSSLAMQAINVIWDMYNDLKIYCGDPSLKDRYPEDWNKYAEGIEILCTKFPELASEFNGL